MAHSNPFIVILKQNIVSLPLFDVGIRSLFPFEIYSNISENLVPQVQQKVSVCKLSMNTSLQGVPFASLSVLIVTKKHLYKLS
jgi:hypothetical protein